ncbi:MAG: phage holin family protein [Rhodospirillales bacterium]|nr:phage holin family protein [Rhodospirillales bacterium]
MMHMRDDLSFTALLSQLTHEVTTLFRKEVELAKAEFTLKASQARSGAVAVAAGGLVLFIALQALVAAAILGLGTVVAWWLAALIVGLVIAVIGAAVLFKGIANLRAENLAPRRTITTLRDNSSWAREQLR